MPLDRNRRPIRSLGYAKYRRPLPILSDLYLAIVFSIGIACFIAASISIANGKTRQPFIYVPPISEGSTNSLGSFVTHFTWLFLPSFLFAAIGSAFLNADLFYRNMQPLCGMDRANLAEENLLLDYLSTDPVTTIIKALNNSHWRVAWHAFLAIHITIPPILAGRVFLPASTTNGYEIHIDQNSLYLLVSLLGLYCISFYFVRPPDRFRAPRIIFNVLDLVSYCYMSTVKDNAEFCVQEPDDREIHLVSKVHLAKRRYQFGMYLGLDGHRHMGFDVSEWRTPEGEVYYPVDTFNPCSAFYGGFINWYFRTPRISHMQQKDQTHVDGSRNADGVHRTSDDGLEDAVPLNLTETLPTAAADEYNLPPSMRYRRVDTEASVGLESPRMVPSRTTAVEVGTRDQVDQHDPSEVS